MERHADMTPVVLLVEDDPDHAELAIRGLEGSAVELVVVDSLAAARAWLAARTADLVLTDVRLPDGGAFDLLAECTAPVVVMTSFGEEQAERAIRAGAIDYVIKSPEMFRELPVIVARNLRQSVK
jgi:two-component system cell cycle sensor histidine kinase/response regulator CckA